MKAYKSNFTKTLNPSDSSPGKLSEMAKVHKSNVLLYPMVSMVEREKYYLPKFLDSLIKPHLPITYLLKLTSLYMDHVKQFKFNKNQIMVICVVVSLFAKFPLSEANEVIANCLYHKHDS